MATKFTRFNVRCTICDEVFLNDYTGRHTKSKHKELNDDGRTAPTTVVVEEDVKQRRMETFFQQKSRTYTAKKRIADEADVENPNARGKSNDQRKKTRLEEADGVTDGLHERAENGRNKFLDIFNTYKIDLEGYVILHLDNHCSHCSTK